jgi:hypothetical protein
MRQRADAPQTCWPARVTDHGFHLVFRDELQLLELARAIADPGRSLDR